MKMIKFNSEHNQKGFMLQISKTEAYSLIESLAAQLSESSPNSGRKEFNTIENEYVSIAVMQ